MAKTKADLIAEAEAKGIDLTGSESAAELKSLLLAAGESEAEVDGDEPPPMSDSEQAVADAAQKVADAKAVLDQATAEHAAAVANHAGAVKAAQPVADPAIHIGIEKPGGYDLLEHPEAKERLARMNVGGQNVEHVSEGENGVWVYRPM